MSLEIVKDKPEDSVKVESRMPKVGDILMVPMTFTNGRRKDSPKFESHQKEVPFVIVNRDGELWAEYHVKTAEFKLADEFQPSNNLTPES